MLELASKLRTHLPHKLLRQTSEAQRKPALFLLSSPLSGLIESSRPPHVLCDFPKAKI